LTGRSVVVGDVTADPRYLTTFGNTRSEIVVPIRDGEGTVTGLIDVESDLVNAFDESDRLVLERCARALAPLFDRTGEKPVPGE
jgi:putative methionine-R-sulfoxide reductase with GAF domain